LYLIAFKKIFNQKRIAQSTLKLISSPICPQISTLFTKAKVAYASPYASASLIDMGSLVGRNLGI